MRRIEIASGLVLALACASGAQEAGVSQKEILVGSCSDLIGANKIRSLQLLDGAKAYFASVNEKGGIYGRRLKLLSYDDGNDVKQAVACFKRLQDQGVFAGAFFLSSPPASRYAPMAEYNRIPVLGFLSGAPFLYEPVKHYVFAVHPSHRDMIQNPVDHGWNELGLRRIGVLHEDTAFGKGVVDGAERALRRHSAELSEVVAFSPKTRDFGSAIERLRAADAQMVILAGPGTAVSEMIRQSEKSGWSPLFVSVSNDPGMMSSEAEHMDGTVILQAFPSPAQTDLPTVALYNRLLKRLSKGSAHPSYAGLEGFVDAVILVEGLKRAGRSLTRDKFVDALESIQNFDLGLGPGYRISWGPEAHQGVGRISPTIIREGKQAPLEWRSLKTGLKAAP